MDIESLLMGSYGDPWGDFVGGGINNSGGAGRTVNQEWKWEE